MKTMTHITMVVATDRPEGMTREAEQLRVYQAIVDAANDALQQFQPVEGTISGQTFGAVTLVPLGS